MALGPPNSTASTRQQLKLSSSSDAIQTLMTNFTTAKSQNLYMGKQSQQLIPFQIIFWVVVSIYALFVGYCLFESQCIKPDQMKKYEGKKLSVPASCIILFSSIAIIAGIYEYVVKDDLQEGYANAKCSAMAYLVRLSPLLSIRAIVSRFALVRVRNWQKF